MLLAVSTFSCLDATSKHLAAAYAVPTIVWARYVSQMVLMVAVLGPRSRLGLVRTAFHRRALGPGAARARRAAHLARARRGLLRRASHRATGRRPFHLVSPLSTLFYPALVGSLAVPLVFPSALALPESWADAALFAALGVLGGIGHFFLIRAHFHPPASTLGRGLAVLGMLVIAASGLVLAFSHRRSHHRLE